MTEIEEAKALADWHIRRYVERGDTLQSLKAGYMGYAGDGNWVSIGGHLNGKNIRNDKIVVSKLKGKAVGYVF